MPLQTRIPRAIALAFLLYPLLYGCAFDMARLDIPLLADPVPLPEQIHRAAPAGLYQFARIGVFRFDEPAGHVNVGRTAAEDLFKQLEAASIFTEVVSLLGEPNQGLEARLELASARNLDLIATGRVLYYLDGSAFAESRVDEELTIYKVKTREILWQATAVEVGRPRAEQDYFLYKTAGHPPPPPATLLARNTAKFINLLQWVYPAADNGAAQEMKPATGQSGQVETGISEEPITPGPPQISSPESAAGNVPAGQGQAKDCKAPQPSAP